ncbi:concanavalin A-like lectin/glucanase [Aureobasidium pullulans]|uniref:Concanavalin A-like lectin/glucanase n=1 Tax=Aureobasidium pullulans TaxID=5580 RepID=A0A4S9Z577_AURPU|nr:concanavalin A-like lectin/glucanase [Aureobasidium pullulans]TIA01093.1 concanavalin A-like lectin/glucanase [Aureobasidium pullulans]
MSIRRTSALSLVAMGAAGVSAFTASNAGVKNGCFWNVDGLGSFNTQWSIAEFTTSTLSSVQDELSASSYTVEAGNSPLARRFDITNIGISSDNALTLTVPGGQSTGPISSAQITTAYSDILFGSVRTVAMVSGAAGTTHGFTFYANDNQEVDFAFLSSDPSVVHLTNEQVNSTSPFSTYTVSAPSDATSAYHEYRLDWTADATRFYIDGTLVHTITENVPSQQGFWLWNSWSNGNAWAQGPPATNSVLKIKSIDAYFNRTSVIPSGSCLSSSSNNNAAAAAASSTSTAPTYTPAPTAANVKLCPKYDGTVYTATNGDLFQVACGTDFAGGDFKMVWVNSMSACIEACSSTEGCVDVSMSGTACYMKNKLKNALKNSGVNGAKKISA